METVTSVGAVNRKQQMIQRKLKWYDAHHKEQDDITAAELAAMYIKIADKDFYGALYDAYRFGFARGYNAAVRDGKGSALH